MGENGAGKTTLMNVLYGLYQPDTGTILIDGKQRHIKSPRDAISAGLGMVHQHFMLVRNMSVTENLALGFNDGKSPLLHLDVIEKQITDLCSKYSIHIDPQSKIEQLTVGEQQRVEILNLLLRDAKVFILDEPTAVLTPLETEALLVSLQMLKQQGKSIVFISHKLEEVMAIADRINVLRRGVLVSSLEKSNTNREELATLMVGREVFFSFERSWRNPQPDVLSVDQLKVKNNRGLLAVNGVTFSLEKGEILGIAGVEGNGQNELCEAIAGIRKIELGDIRINNILLRNYDSLTGIRKGISYIPEDRQRTGLVLEFPVWKNSILKRFRDKEFNRFSLLQYSQIRSFTRKLIEEYTIRVPDEWIKTWSLSGGNQQKLIFARELSLDPLIIIANQPTRGLDIGATEYVHSKLLQQRDAGKGILIISRELSELLLLCDRIAVMFEGKILDILTSSEATVPKIGSLMAGLKTK